MLTVIISWLILFMVFLAFGEIGIMIWNKITKQDKRYSIIDKLWLGLSVIGSLLLYISLFAPINIIVLASFLLVTLLFLWTKKDCLTLTIKKIKEILGELSALEKDIFVCVFITVLIYSLSAPLIYDEGLYHLQSMQWSEKYKAILGLGNLHGRLGFNSSFLLLSTLFNYHPSIYDPYFTINSFALLIFSFWLLELLIRSQNILQKLTLVFILIISLFTLGANVSSSSTDILVNILIIYLLVNWAIKKDYALEKPLMIFLIIPFCITLKLSAGVMFLALILCCLTLLNDKEKQKAIIPSLLIGIIIALPWLARFVIQTGYLVYPYPSVDIFSVDWKIPLELATEEKISAYAWARIPDMDVNEVAKMSFLEWLPIWVKNLSLYRLVIYIIALLSPLLLIFSSHIYNKKHIIKPWLVALLGILFSFFTAPDFRFSFGFIISAACIPFLMIDNRIKLPQWDKVLSSTLLLFLIGLSYVGFSQIKTYQNYTDRSITSLLLSPLPTNTLKNRDKIEFEEYKIKNTFIFAPRGTNQCFDQEIPCIPYQNTNLELRGDDIKDGFRIKK